MREAGRHIEQEGITMSDAKELESLRREVAELRERVAQLSASTRQSSPPAHREADAAAEASVSRRNWVRAAAGAAVVGTAAALAPRPAAAVDPNDVVLGAVNTTTQPTTINFTGNEDIGFLAQSGTEFFATASSVDAALAGWTSRTQHPVGVYGFTNVNSSNAAGVVGTSDLNAGAGIRAEHRRSGVGLRATSVSGTAVSTQGAIGVDSSGNVVGLQGRSTSGLGADMAGGQAAMLLSGSGTDPTTRTNAHAAGEVDVAVPPGSTTERELWFCADGGSPGVWRKLAGAGTAGAFHPAAPGRAYDSRVLVPNPGMLATGVDRTVSVADGRDADTGEITLADLVPEGATAIAFNLTITETVGAGFLSLAPGDSTESSASTINWGGPGVTVANAGIVKLDDARQVKVFAGGAGSTHFLLDITGYFL
ncbi:MAG: hypothetical protein AAFP84_07555 [Actinomycetota bacterium]